MSIKLAPSTVRHYLDILEHHGLVSNSDVRKTTGRPKYSFHLTEKGYDSIPKDYSRLLNARVSVIKNITVEKLVSRSGNDVDHNVDMSAESNDFVHSLDAKQLAIIDSWALGG